MRKIALSLAFLCAPAAPGFADDSRLLGSISMAQVRSILEAEGFTIVNTGQDGPNSIRAKEPDGLVFNILGTACDTDLAANCLGLDMQVRYDADGDETLERINAANLMWKPTSTSYSKTGSYGAGPQVFIVRYVILDDGVTIGNIKQNLINLLAIAPQVADYVWQAGVYAPDYGEDIEDWDW
jgi:hypothetical protein